MSRLTAAGRLILVGALASGALAACGQQAPGVTTPTGAPQTAGSSSGSSSESSQSTDPSSSSSSATASGAVCKSRYSFGPPYNRTMATKPFGTMQEGTDDLDRTEQVLPQKPRQIPAGSAYVEDGMQLVAVDVKVHLSAGTTDYVSTIDFLLSDAQGNPCQSDSSSSAIPLAQQLSGVTLGSSTKDAAGALIFEVPTGLDLNTLTLTYGDSLGKQALAQWKG